MKPTDPAFSQSFAADSDGHMYTAAEKSLENSGMDIRTYLAGQAMQGLLSANPEILHGNIELPIPSNVAGYAVKCADALIEELNKEQK